MVVCRSQAKKITFELAKFLSHRLCHIPDQQHALPKGRSLGDSLHQKIAVANDHGQLINQIMG